VVKILQGSIVTQTMLGGLTTYPHPVVANFLHRSAKDYEAWLAADSYCKNKHAYFFGPPCM